MERHLVQARAKAIAEDERNLEDLSSACPSFQSIGVPQCPSQFHKHLSEELLARHELLIPSQWLLKPRSLTRGGRSVSKLNPNACGSHIVLTVTSTLIIKGSR